MVFGLQTVFDLGQIFFIDEEPSCFSSAQGKRYMGVSGAGMDVEICTARRAVMVL